MGIVHIGSVNDLLEVDMTHGIGTNIIVVYEAEACARYGLEHPRCRGSDVGGNCPIPIPILIRISTAFQTRRGGTIVVLVKRGVGGHGVEAVPFEQSRPLVRAWRGPTGRVCRCKLDANCSEEPEEMCPGHFGGAGLDTYRKERSRSAEIIQEETKPLNTG